MDFTTLSLADLLAVDFSTLSAEALAAYQLELRTRAYAIRDAEGTPTNAQVDEAQSLAARFAETRDFVTAQAAEALADEPASEEAVAALAELSLEDEPVEEPAETPVEEPVEAAVEEPVETPVETVTAAAPTPAPAPRRAAVALAGQRPTVPAHTPSPVTITAAADTQYATGSNITLQDAGFAVQHRLKGLAEPNGDGTTEDLRYFPVANIGLDYPEELQVNPRMDEEAIEQVLQHATDETRLEGNSLVASAGWCAPSETLYDLCAGEVVDGILSVAEVQVNRGGFKHTTGIDFSTIYSGVGFLQTEAQAIAGTAKTCYEVPCPTFVDERLDAIGLCIKVPILLEVGYPEAVQRVMTGSMIAHQYKVNASVISRISTIAGAAIDFMAASDFASATGELLMAIDLEADILRQKYRLGKSASMEVVLPVWAFDVIRTELGLRNGRPKDAVTDDEVMSHFNARHVNVQFVYGYQELAGTEVTWPATVEFMIYPAGTLVKGVSNVINLSAVYDAASLVTNIYTGLFFEQGLLVAKMCYEVRRVTIPVTGAFTGKTGAAAL